MPKCLKNENIYIFNSLQPGIKLEWPILLWLFPYMGTKGLKYENPNVFFWHMDGLLDKNIFEIKKN